MIWIGEGNALVEIEQESKATQQQELVAFVELTAQLGRELISALKGEDDPENRRDVINRQYHKTMSFFGPPRLLRPTHGGACFIFQVYKLLFQKFKVKLRNHVFEIKL